VTLRFGHLGCPLIPIYSWHISWGDLDTFDNRAEIVGASHSSRTWHHPVRVLHFIQPDLPWHWSSSLIQPLEAYFVLSWSIL
jgi:hypothetical protein